MESLLRILHILNHTGRLGGNVHAVVDLACAQAAQGEKVGVCSCGGDFDEIFARAGVETFHVDPRRPLRIPASALAFARLCRSWKPDVVHAHMTASAAFAWPVTRLLGLPLVTTAHNAFERAAALMALGDRIIAVSRLAGVAMLRKGAPENRIRVVLNGTIGSARLEDPPPPPTRLLRPSVVFVGGLHPRKGVDVLLRATRIMVDRYPLPHLYLVGDGPMRADYEALTVELGLQKNVTFVGGVPDPRPYMASADVFVLPSRADPAPLVLSEARQFRCAIVASDVDGVAEMLDDGAAGVLVPPDDAERLAAAVVTLLIDPSRRRAVAARANEGLARFHVERVARETRAVYREAIESRGAGRQGAIDPPPLPDHEQSSWLMAPKP